MSGMTVQIDLETISRLILRNCKGALAELGFEFDTPDYTAGDISFEFAYNENGDCVGLIITQDGGTEESPA